MPGYVMKDLAKYQHPPPLKPQHAPHKWNAPIYGQNIQLAPNPDTSENGQKGKKKIQQISGTFLYYGRAMEPPILVALNDIGTQQAATTKK